MAEVRRQEFVVSLADIAAFPNKVLAENEFLYVRQADGKLKMMCGDGVTAVSALPYTLDIGAMEQAVIDAQAAADTAATDTVNAASLLLSGYVTDAQTAKADAETAQGLAEAAKVAAEQVVIDTKTKLNENTSGIKSIEETLINYNPAAETRLTQTTADRVISLPKNAGEGGLKSIINGNTLKNETTYNRDTWAEWTLINGATRVATGIELTPYGESVVGAWINTTIKNNTKYGIIFNIVSNTLNGNMNVGSGSRAISFGTISAGATGMQKLTATSQAEISDYSFIMNISSKIVTSGKVNFKDVRIFELPAGSQIESDFTNLTADQLAARYPYIDGIKSVTAPRVKSVGKNLLSLHSGNISTSAGSSNQAAGTSQPIYKNYDIIYGATRNGFINSGNVTNVSIDAESNTVTFKSLSAGYGIGVKIKDTVIGATYTKNTAVVGVGFFDTDGTLISSTISETFIIPENTAFLFAVFAARDASEANTLLVKSNAQLELGSTATTYEPYKESFLYPEPKTLHRLPNGVCDTIENGNYIQRVKEYTLQASDITQLITTGPNYDRAFIHKPIDYIRYNVTSPANNLNGTLLLEGSLGDRTQIVDSVEMIGYISDNSSTTGFGYYVAKGTYADLAAAQTALVGKKIWYQLANPIVTENVTSGIPLSYPSGSIYLEPALADAGVYTDKISILQTAFPISSLESIKKINAVTGEETPLDVSTAVINADKLSFTHPNLALNDIVFFTYFYPEDGCYGSNTFSYFDSRYVKVDSVTGKYYKIDFSIADGVPAFNLVEVV